MAFGVLALGNSLRVAAFTLMSVACAESKTAASNSIGELKFSSVVGLGLTARKRLKISRRFKGFRRFYFFWLAWRSAPWQSWQPGVLHDSDLVPVLIGAFHGARDALDSALC